MILANIITDLCLRAGLDGSEIDVSLITDENVQPVSEPGGYLVERPQAAAAALREVMQAFFIDCCESNGQLVFVPRASSTASVTIPETDLGLVADNAELVEQLAAEQDLPQSVTTVYVDASLDYQQGKQLKARNPRIITIVTKNQEIRSLPFTLTADDGRQIAEVTLYTYWQNRTSYVMNLWRACYLLLDPTDLVHFVYEGVTYLMRIVTSRIGQGAAVALQGVSENPLNYVSIAVGSD